MLIQQESELAEIQDRRLNVYSTATVEEQANRRTSMARQPVEPRNSSARAAFVASAALAFFDWSRGSNET
ncbi:MAG TPA: hypothetical protein DDY91_09790 [Planctomycetaceae bacterium]|nr:hypothetical protein [Planctomycetaceae bacterium]